MVKITKTAARMMARAAEQKGWDIDECYLRLYISDNTAALMLTKDRVFTDEVYTDRGITIVIDDIANTWLSTATVDYEDHGDMAGFTVDAPDLPSAGSAGCGSCVGDFGCC